MSNIVIFGATQSGKTTLLGYLTTAMLRHPQFNDEVLQKLKLIRRLTSSDEFNIGNPNNPINVQKDVILPSFVSLDRDELRKFRNQNTEGTSKRLHRKQLTICMSERESLLTGQDENENASCIFVDLPGFRQRLSDKYRGFFEGDIGIAVLNITEILALDSLIKPNASGNCEKDEDYYVRRLFEPMRIWCDYRSPSRLLIVISQIDRVFPSNLNPEEATTVQLGYIQKAIDCIKLYTERFSKGIDIPISPISIRIRNEENTKHNSRMTRFFYRDEENIYIRPPKKNLPGSGTFISCLKRIMIPYKAGKERAFSMASVYKPMRAKVGNTTKTALNILALHGTIHLSDSVILGPIVDKQSDETFYAECTISSLKADGVKEPSDMLLEGNVGGIIFNSIRKKGKTSQYTLDSIPENSDVRILKSTILFAGDFESGDIVDLEINRDDYITVYGTLDDIYLNILPSMKPYDPMILFWYGKKIAVNVVEIINSYDKIKFSVIISNSERNSVRHFAMPYQAGSILHRDSVLLAIPESNYTTRRKNCNQEVHTYVSANIVGLKNSADYDTLEITANQELALEDILNGSVNYKTNDFDNGSKLFSVPIKSKFKNIDIYSVLSNIKRSMRKQFYYSNYRQLGGITLRLDITCSNKST